MIKQYYITEYLQRLELFNGKITQSINQSINQSIDRSIHQLINSY